MSGISKTSHICALVNDGLDVDSILSQASRLLYEGPDNESLSVLAVLAKHGECNEYEIGKKGQAYPTNYNLDRYAARRRICKYSRYRYPSYPSLKELGLITQRDGPQHRSGKIIHRFSLTLKGLMACLQKRRVKFEECFPVVQLSRVVSNWSANNSSLVAAFLQCMKYNMALFMYFYAVNGFKLIHQKDTVSFFLSWNESNPMVRGFYLQPQSSVSEEEKRILQKLQFRFIISQILFREIRGRLINLRSDLQRAPRRETPEEFHIRKNRKTGYEYLEFIWSYLHDWPERIETMQLKDEKSLVEPEELPHHSRPALKNLHIDVSAAKQKAMKILQAENFEPYVAPLSLVWQGDLFNEEDIWHLWGP